MSAYIKDPDAVLDFGCDWSDWLAAGETITSSVWTIAPADTSPSTGLVQNSDSHNDTATTVWLSGGVDGTDYAATNHIVTSAGREDDRTLTVKVRQR